MSSEGLNKDLGPAIVTWNGIDLGPTKGGVIVRYSEEFAEVMEDQRGKWEVDSINVGGRCEVEAPLTRVQFATLKAMVAGASGATGSTMNIKTTVGTSSYDRAQELIVKPQIAPGVAAANTKWFNFPKAFPRPNFEVGFDVENQRVYKVIFKCYILQGTLSGYTSGSVLRIGPSA